MKPKIVNYKDKYKFLGQKIGCPDNKWNDSSSWFIANVPKVHYSGESVKLNLFQVRTTYDSIYWFQLFGV